MHVVPGRDRNLELPKGVIGENGLVIEEPEPNLFFLNRYNQLGFQRETDFNLATTEQLNNPLDLIRDSRRTLKLPKDFDQAFDEKTLKSDGQMQTDSSTEVRTEVNEEQQTQRAADRCRLSKEVQTEIAANNRQNNKLRQTADRAPDSDRQQQIQADNGQNQPDNIRCRTRQNQTTKRMQNKM
ncbi:hypothetical protein Tco_0741591 [Tanacetum coccineum]